MSDTNSLSEDVLDAETVYTYARDSCIDPEVVYQNIHSVKIVTVFYRGKGRIVTLGGMMNSGSMGCSISETAAIRLREFWCTN